VDLETQRQETAVLIPKIRPRYRLWRRKFQSWFRLALALIMVGAAVLGAGAAYFAAAAEEESIILKQRLVAGRLVEVAAWAKYAHEYATWTALTTEAVDHKNLGLRLSRTADSVREADAAEAALLDLQAQEEFARARIYRTFYHFLKHREKPSNVESLSSDVSVDLARFGFGADDGQTAADTSHAAHKAAGSTSLAPGLELKFWQVLDERLEDLHGRVLRYSRAVVLFVLTLALFTFADLNSDRFRRSIALAGAGLLVVIGTAIYTVWIDVLFLIPVGAVCLIGVAVVWFASARGLLRSESAKSIEEHLHAHEVEGKSYWGASLFLRQSHDARSRLAVTLIAMTVLLSSVVSYLYVEAATTRAKFSHESLKYQVAFGKSSASSASDAIAEALQPTINHLAKQIHCAAATQQEMFPWRGAEKKVSEFGGVGLSLAMERGQPRIDAVREDGPAAAAGIRAGDLITEIDGASTTAMPLDAFLNRLRGRIGTLVELRISRDGAVLPIPFNLTRRKIVVEGEIAVLENGAALIRNRKVACEELTTKQSIQKEEEITRAEYDGGLDPGLNLYYRAVYSSPSGNPARLYALADGYEELAALSNRHATVYLASLTFFAIALYLFGQALGVGYAWQAQTFLGFGGVLVALSVGWTLVTWGKSPERRRDIAVHCTDGLRADASASVERLVETAAHQYGQGEALYYLADTPAEYRKAADALDCAVAARPNFARAHSLRSSAYESVDSSGRWDTYLPASSWSRPRDVIAARTQALTAFERNNVTPRWIAYSNAFDRLVLALIEGDRAALASSIPVLAGRVASVEQRGAGTSSPMAYMNYGLALLADNRPREAETYYKHAIDGLRTAKDMRTLVEALTDLRMLTTNCTNLNSAQTCAELSGSVRKIKESLVAAEWRDGPGDERARLSDMSIQITPSSAGWRAKLAPEAAKAHRKMTTVWYMLDTASADGRPEGITLWRAVHGLSRTIEVASLKPDADGTVELVVPYTREQNRCLAEGTYVPEIYIDGALVSPADLPAAPLPRFEIYRSRYMNLKLCHPAGWTGSSGAWQFPMRVFQDAQKQPSAVLFTFYTPRAAPAEQLKNEYLITASSYMLKFMASSQDIVRAWAGGLDMFKGCNTTAPKGIAHREWVTAEGFVHVAIVHLWIPTEDACHVLNSLDSYFTPNSLSGGG
jgi:tetratricopeptide (TPR) repeat protein